MRVLIDTHTLIWSAMDAPELSPSVRSLLGQPETVAVYSLASFWEISIKVGIGKLHLTVPLATFFEEIRARKRFEALPLEEAHCLRYATLPLYHRDPFDRMLIAPSLTENLTIVSNDNAIDAYGARRIW